MPNRFWAYLIAIFVWHMASKATAVGSESNLRKLRILALHGGMSCARKFKSGTMKNLMRNTKDIAVFEFMDAPFLTRCPIFEEGKIIGYPTEDLCEKKRSWWGWNSFDRDDDRYAVAGHEQEGIVYQRMDESLDALWNLWQQDPFDGILGFSQGAITASIFVDWMARTKPADHLAPKFLILVSAFLKPVPLNYPEYWIRDQDRELLGSLLDPASIERFQAGNVHGLDPTDAEDIDVWRTIHGMEHEPCEAGGFVATKRSISTIPSLHIYGEGDLVVPNARSLALALRYDQAQVYQHRNKRPHDVPNDQKGIAVIRAFLQRFL